MWIKTSAKTLLRKYLSYTKLGNNESGVSLRLLDYKDLTKKNHGETFVNLKIGLGAELIVELPNY